MKSTIKLFLIIVAIAAVAFISFYVINSSGVTGRTLSTTFFPVYDVVKNIAGDQYDVVQIVPDTAEVHEYEPSISDVLKIKSSQALFYVGAGIDDWSVSLADDGTSSVVRKVNLSNEIDLAPYPVRETPDEKALREFCESNSGTWLREFSECENISESSCSKLDGNFLECESSCRHNDEAENCTLSCVSVCAFRGELSEDSSAKYDPHYWLSLYNIAQTAKKVLSTLVEIDPLNQGYYENNYNKYIALVNQTKSEVEELTLEIKGSKIITFHDAFNYFAKEVGVEVASVVEIVPGVEPSAAYLSELSKVISNNNIRVVFIEQGHQTDLTTVFTNDFRVNVAELSPLESGSDGKAFLDLYLETIQNLVNALN